MNTELPTAGRSRLVASDRTGRPWTTLIPISSPLLPSYRFSYRFRLPSAIRPNKVPPSRCQGWRSLTRPRVEEFEVATGGRAPLLLIHSCLALCLRPSSLEGCQLLRPLLTSIRSRHALPRAAPRHLAAFAASFVRVDRQLFHTPGSCSASGPFWLCSRQVTLPRRTDLPE